MGHMQLLALALDSESSQGVVSVLAIRGALNSTREKR